MGSPIRAWKDVVLVPARSRTVFRDFTGRTMYRCHILDHEALGMMGVLEIGSTGKQPRPCPPTPCGVTSLRDPAEFVWIQMAASEPSINPPFHQPQKSAHVFLAFSIPRINALRGYVIENKSRPIFPSWTSWVRIPSPAPSFQQLAGHRVSRCTPITPLVF